MEKGKDLKIIKILTAELLILEVYSLISYNN
ncbi:hypothetical protein SAMN05421856_101653 [Chryseobacterium taichungense]|uniref:Uncharacterized protein n=1 Tax=Chryseobacterium taichungense TaxID=295069 RepID=A0A1H7WD71_9FLAO|nr:hypothetical protein SAMN05421856_101653 [Chryseobacterium taichungense]